MAYSGTRTQSRTGPMTSVPPSPPGPLLPRHRVAAPAQGRTGRTSCGSSPSPFPCHSVGLDSRAESLLCVQLRAGAVTDTLSMSPHCTHFTDEEAEAHRAAATCPSPAVRGAGSYPIGRLEAPVVGDVLPEGVAAVHGLPVHAVVAVLLHHALCLPLESLHGRVLPPGPEVPVLVILPSCRVRGKCQVPGKGRQAGACGC